MKISSALLCCIALLLSVFSNAFAASDIKGMIEEGKASYKNKQFNKAISTFLQVANMTGRDRNMALSDPEKYEEQRYFNAVSYYWAGLSTHELSKLSKNSEEKNRKYREAMQLYHTSCEAGYDKACSKYDSATSGNLNNAINSLRSMRPPPRQE